MRERARQWLLGGLILGLLGVTAFGLVSGSGGEQDRVAALEYRLRCPTCKTVSIAESPSETAASMRKIVAEQVAAGRTDEQIVAYFTSRYGEWVLLDPPRSGDTLLLWLLPLAAAAAGLAVILSRTRSSPGAPAELPDAEREQVQAALHRYRLRAEEDEEP